MPKVSVVIPIFNVEQYIERCARSLFEQTLDDIEYLFIDDCSSDTSVEILLQVLTEYPNRKSQVILHRMEQNSGSAAVRKWGILHSTGEYTINCDSDDWIAVDTYRSMYDKAVTTNSDLVFCDMYRSDGNSSRLMKGCIHESLEESLRDICSMKISWSLCNKLIRTTLLQDGIVFPNGDMGEDMATVVQVMLKAKQLSYIPCPFYYYYSNPNSITRLKESRHIEKIFRQAKDNLDIAIKSIKEYHQESKYQDCLCVMKWNVKNKLVPIIHIDKYYRLWRGTYPETDRQLWLNPHVSLKDKAKYAMALIRLYPDRRNRISISDSSL